MRDFLTGIKIRIESAGKDLENSPVARRIRHLACTSMGTISRMPRKSRRARSVGGRRSKNRERVKLLAAVFIVAIAAIGLKSVTHSSFIKLPTLKEQKAGAEVYDIDDKLITVVQKTGEREPISLDQISPFMRQAVIGIEDHNFYNHAGIDPFGISRAMYKNIMAQQWIEGGSTITQQLMKTMYFGQNRTAISEFRKNRACKSSTAWKTW